MTPPSILPTRSLPPSVLVNRGYLVDDIAALLPHRYPFLLVDKVLEEEPGKRIVAIKNVSHNEPWVDGHFPGNPIMPGVLIVEAMAQAAALLGFQQKKDQGEQGGVLLMGLDKVRFKRPVRPGDQLKMELIVKRGGSRIWVVSGKAWVGDELAAQADITAAFSDE